MTALQIMSLFGLIKTSALNSEENTLEEIAVICDTGKDLAFSIWREQEEKQDEKQGEKKSVAEMISFLLTNKEVPNEISDALIDALLEIESKGNFDYSVENITRILNA